jgi:hypothetical protein
MSYRRTYKYLRHYLIASFSTTLLLASVLAPQIQLADAGSKSPYDSGYDHGCDDAGISDPSDRYINEPGKGPSFHTDEFMQGYNAGYNACSGQDGGGNEPDESTGSSSVRTSGGSWTLTVTVTNPPFGIKDVYVRVYGPYGWSEALRGIWSELQDAGDPDRVSMVFDVPPNAIPEGRIFKVCANSNFAAYLIDSNCRQLTYSGGGDTEVEIRLP